MKTSEPANPNCVMVEYFEKITRWVNVTLRSFAKDVEFLNARDSFVRNRYGRDVYVSLIPLISDLRDSPSGASERIRLDRLEFEACRSLRGYKAAEITLSFKEYQWKALCDVAKTLGFKVEVIIRQGLWKRMISLKAFDESGRGRGVGK